MTTPQSSVDLIDEIAADAAGQVMMELKERNLLGKTTPRYDDELQMQIAAIIAVVIDESLDINADEDEDDDLLDEEEDEDLEH
jgi:hypothetical protein